MPYAVRTTRVEPAPTAVVRRRAPPHQLSKVVPEACGTVWSVVTSLGVRGAGRHVAVYLTGSLDQVDMEIGVELAAPFGGHGEVVDSATPGGEVATVAHFGPYASLGDAHRAIRDWCAANNRTPAGPNWEVYGHWMPEWNTDPSKIRTDVFYLLQ
jgi:effector-binding domain-containing protein